MPEEPTGPQDQAQRPLRIGLTGGIASGKSAAAQVFAGLGIPVIDTDEIAREVVEPGTPGLGRVVDAFGPDVLDSDGRLDRKRLRGVVFKDAVARRRLEQILHPLIRATMNARSAAAGGLYQVLVIPLLVESGLASGVDRVLVVDCTEEAQVGRVMQRDNVGAPEARAILRAQASREQRLALADDVIVNDADLAALERKVRELDDRYRLLAAGRARRG
jgi:dephospho-CoA kinase